MLEQGSKAMVSPDFWMYSEAVMWPGQKNLQQLGPQEKNNSARVCTERNVTSVL